MRDRSTLTRVLAGGLGIFYCLWLPVAHGHHPILAKFDAAQPVSLTGLVTEINWANPHAHIFLNVEQSSGAPENWAIELESPLELEWSGWESDTVAVGDTLTVEGIRALDGSLQAWGTTVESSSGEALFVIDEGKEADILSGRPSGATPRWPDGQPRLGPPAGETGYWMSPGLNSLVETGVEVEMDRYGVLSNLDDASSVAPFQPWAEDLYKLRQSNYLKDDPSFLYCIPPGGPRQFQFSAPLGVQFVEQRNRERVFVLMGGGNSNWRLIYTDGRSQVGQVSGDDTNPLFYGRAVAQWEGDTLVVDTVGFNESFWFSNGGLPHTRQLHLIERFSRPDLNTLRYEVTVDDPGAYTRTWTSSWDLQWVPGEELPEFYCQDNRP